MSAQRTQTTQRRRGTLTCIVLDLDETLVNTRKSASERIAVIKALKQRGESDRYYEFKLDGALYWGVKRPYVPFFTSWCFDAFDVVGVWTAAERSYADAVVASVFQEQRPHFVWAREQCGTNRGMYYKPMSSLFTAFPDLDAENSIILDDRVDVAKYNLPLLLEIPSFDYRNPLTYDRVLVVALAFLRDALASGVPLRNVDKSDVFASSTPVVVTPAS